MRSAELPLEVEEDWMGDGRGWSGLGEWFVGWGFGWGFGSGFGWLVCWLGGLVGFSWWVGWLEVGMGWRSIRLVGWLVGWLGVRDWMGLGRRVSLWGVGWLDFVWRVGFGLGFDGFCGRVQAQLGWP